MRRICHLIFLLLCFLEGGVWSLRNLSITAPRAVLAGEGQSALLRCSYDLKGLLSTRYVGIETSMSSIGMCPRELPPTMVFPLPGATVDLTQSDDHQVFIVNMNRHLSGVYLCEVSADAPLFHTDLRSAPLTIVDVPFHAPRLSISRVIYARNDVLYANCSIDEAYPAPNVTWILDDNEIAQTISRQILEIDFKERGAFSQLEITIRESDSYKSQVFGNEYQDLTHSSHHGHNQNGDSYAEYLRYAMVPPPRGQFTVSCVATIFDIYVRTSELVYIKEDSPRPASVTGEDSSGETTLCNFLFISICVCISLVDRTL